MRRFLPHPLTVLLVLLLAGIGALAWLFVTRPHGNAARARDEAALAAARQTAVNSASYDYRTIDKQLAVIASELTGAALTQFEGQKADIKSSVAANKTVATGHVLDSGLVPASIDTGGAVRTLVALDVTYVVNGGTPATQTQLLEVDMVRQGIGWVAENIIPVTPSAS